MNDVAKLYQIVLNREIAVANQTPLDVKRIKLKVLAFIDTVYRLGELTHVFTFWEKERIVDSGEVLDTYIDGLNLLFSIGYEIRIDKVKKHDELTKDSSLPDLMLTVNKDALKFLDDYSPLIYQDTLDDYFYLGFGIGITYDDIIEKL